MKTVIVTCDICGRVIAPEDVRYVEIEGKGPRDIDAACLLATTDMHADRKSWELLRDAACKKIEKELSDVAVAEAVLVP